MTGVRAAVGTLALAVAAAAAAPAARGDDGPADAAVPAAPVARRGDDVIEAFGERVPDPYRWLEDGASVEVSRWQAAQDAAAVARLAAVPARDRIVARVNAEAGRPWAGGAPLVRYGRMYAPTWADGGRTIVLGELQPPEYRRSREVLRVRAATAFGLAQVEPSPSGRHVVYATGPASGDRRTIWLHDAEAPTVRDVVVATDTVVPQFAWAADGSGFWWANHTVVRRGDAQLPLVGAVLRFHRVGDDPDNDERVAWPGSEKTAWIGLRVASSGPAVFAVAGEVEDRSAAYELVRRDGKTEVRVVWPPGPGVGEPDQVRGTTFVRTSAGAGGRWLAATTGHETWPDAWTTVLAPPDGVLERVLPVWDRLVAHVRDGGGSRLFVHALGGAKLGFVPLPATGRVTWLGGGGDLGGIWFGFEDLARPPSAHWARLVDGIRVEEVHRVTMAIDLSRLVVERFRVRAADGADVPVAVLRRRDVAFDAKAPTLVAAYGGFGLVTADRWDVRGALFADLGGVFVVAGVRGGGDYGEHWARAGRGLQRHVACDDLVAVAAHLVEQGRADPRRLAYAGASNGGFVVTAAACRRPDLVRAVVCEVPVADLLRFPWLGGGAGACWTPEYGDPTTEAGFRALRALSPVHAPADGPRPALLATAAGLDERADPAHARKLVASWQAARTSGPVLLRVHPASGHALEHGSDLAVALLDSLTFLADQLGLLAPPASPGASAPR